MALIVATLVIFFILCVPWMFFLFHRVRVAAKREWPSTAEGSVVPFLQIVVVIYASFLFLMGSSHLAFWGLHLFRPDLLHGITKNQPDILTTIAFLILAAMQAGFFDTNLIVLAIATPLLLGIMWRLRLRYYGFVFCGALWLAMMLQWWSGRMIVR